jgi:methionyl-tRNA formyltransferase
MKISILCSDPRHPVNRYLENWISLNEGTHRVQLARKKSDLVGGDILFLISCSELLRAADRARYKATLVLHASDLPKGRGWSPHIWAILNGDTELTLSLLDAEDKVDSGAIWMQMKIDVPSHALWNEINDLLFNAELELMDAAVRGMGGIVPRPQDSTVESTYHPKRGPADSMVDPARSLEEQFDLIRTCDPERFPAYFDLHGHRYKIVLEKMP